MKTIKIKLFAAIIAFCLCTCMLCFSGCSSDDDDDNIIDDGPCADTECLNGGSVIKDVEFGTCRCICPAGYSGVNCEIKE